MQVGPTIVPTFITELKMNPQNDNIKKVYKRIKCAVVGLWWPTCTYISAIELPN
jgi:hypothetical protein